MLKRSTSLECPADASPEADVALNVTILYQDLLTLRWATELWDRLGRLVGSGGIHSKSWKLSHLARPEVFSDSVQAAARAHVLVVSVRDAEEFPANLCAWTDAWLANRAGPGGALVALIGVPPQPSHQSGRTYAYLAAAARQAGLDFLPDERKLPETYFVSSNPATQAPQSTRRWSSSGRRSATARVGALAGGASRGLTAPGWLA